MKVDLNITRSEANTLIDEWVFSQRDRLILKRRLLDGICYEKLAEEFELSTQRVKKIVYEQLPKLIIHI